MSYRIRFKRSGSWFWTTKKDITAHNLDREGDRLMLQYSNEDIEEIAEWSKHSCKFGKDFFDYQDKQKELNDNVQPIQK